MSYLVKEKGSYENKIDMLLIDKESICESPLLINIILRNNRGRGGGVEASPTGPACSRRTTAPQAEGRRLQSIRRSWLLAMTGAGVP